MHHGRSLNFLLRRRNNDDFESPARVNAVQSEAIRAAAIIRAFPSLLRARRRTAGNGTIRAAPPSTENPFLIRTEKNDS